MASLHLPKQTTICGDAVKKKHVHDQSATTHAAPAKAGASRVFYSFAI